MYFWATHMSWCCFWLWALARWSSSSWRRLATRRSSCTRRLLWMLEARWLSTRVSKNREKGNKQHFYLKNVFFNLFTVLHILTKIYLNWVGVWRIWTRLEHYWLWCKWDMQFDPMSFWHPVSEGLCVSMWNQITTKPGDFTALLWEWWNGVLI